MEETEKYIKINSTLFDTSNLWCYNSFYERHWPDVFCNHGFIASRWCGMTKYCYIIRGVPFDHRGTTRCPDELKCEHCEPFERFWQTKFRRGAKFTDIVAELKNNNIEYVVEIFARESIGSRIFATIIPFAPPYHLIQNPIRIYPTIEEINEQWEEYKREIIQV